MRKRYLIAILGLLGWGFNSSAQEAVSVDKVVSVYDGDTMRVNVSGWPLWLVKTCLLECVALIHQKFGENARKKNARHTPPEIMCANEWQLNYETLSAVNIFAWSRMFTWMASYCPTN